MKALKIHAALGPDCTLAPAEADVLLGKALRYQAAFQRACRTGELEEANRLSEELEAYGKTVSCPECRAMAEQMATLGAAIDQGALVIVAVPTSPDPRRN